MKRFLCPQHIHHLKKEGKTVSLSSEQCGICKFRARPITLKDMARQLEAIADSMRYAWDNPNYDPFGYTYTDIFKLMNKFYRRIN